jgi:hypothetical protein
VLPCIARSGRDYAMLILVPFLEIGTKRSELLTKLTAAEEVLGGFSNRLFPYNIRNDYFIILFSHFHIVIQ